MRDVVIFDPQYAVYMVNTDALQYLDMLTADDIKARRRLTTILSKITFVLAEISDMRDQGLARKLWGMWWKERKAGLFTSLPRKQFDNLCSQVNAMERHKFNG